MKKNQIIKVDIQSIGFNGEGVARVGEMVVFVPFAYIGETVEVKILQVKSSYAYAKLVNVLQPSSQRIEPPCSVYTKCGGCQLQHINYSSQLQIKKQIVDDCLNRHAKLNVAVNDTVGSDKIYGYRNKLQLPVGTQNHGCAIGFFAPFSHRIVKISGCPLHEDWNTKLIAAFEQYINQANISVYDETNHSGSLRHIVARQVGEDLMITAVSNGNLEQTGVLVETLHFKDFSLYINYNNDRTNVVMGGEFEHIYGKTALRGNALGIKFWVNPQSFLQINDSIRDAMYKQVGEIIQRSGCGNIIDCYSGIGIMSAYLSKLDGVKKVTAIEIVKQATQDADAIKKENNLPNLTNINADSKTVLGKLIADASDTAVVLDPPRKGVEKQILDILLKHQPKTIVYISCNPSTLARDLAELNISYNIDLVQPYDMFPQTKHVETLVCLERKSTT